MSYILNTQNPFYYMRMFNNKNGVLHDYKEKFVICTFLGFIIKIKLSTNSQIQKHMLLKMKNNQ
jgi:hypothetical protein